MFDSRSRIKDFAFEANKRNQQPWFNVTSVDDVEKFLKRYEKWWYDYLDIPDKRYTNHPKFLTELMQPGQFEYWQELIGEEKFPTEINVA